jgi:hypothetical protein
MCVHVLWVVLHQQLFHEAADRNDIEALQLHTRRRRKGMRERLCATTSIRYNT